MNRDSRLSGVLHILLHMAQQDAPVTSEVLARAMDTNPVVIRRTMAGLREHGYIRSARGPGGGWTLACDLTKVTLRDVYEALGCPSLLAIAHRQEKPHCLVEQAVNTALEQASREAEALFLSRLGDVTLASLSHEFRRQLKSRRRAHGLEQVHGS